jgi:hypothetical protein
MNRVALTYYAGEGDDLTKVVARGSATSMGPNGLNPNLT